MSPLWSYHFSLLIQASICCWNFPLLLKINSQIWKSLFRRLHIMEAVIIEIGAGKPAVLYFKLKDYLRLYQCMLLGIQKWGEECCFHCCLFFFAALLRYNSYITFHKFKMYLLIITTASANTSIVSCNHRFFFVVKTFKTYSLNFDVYNTVLLTIVIKLYIRFPEIICL